MDTEPSSSSSIIPTSIPYIPRYNVLARFNGTLQNLIQTLRNNSKDLSLSSIKNIEQLKYTLYQLLMILNDTDNSIQSATEYNGHTILTKLALHPDEEISELVAECISIVNITLPPTLTFPIINGLGKNPPFPLQFQYLLPLKQYNQIYIDTIDKDIFQYTNIYKDLLSLSKDTNDNDTINNNYYYHLSLYQRCIPPWIHRQTSQDDVGQMLWPAAIPFARWLIQHKYLFPYQSILEIGSGMGLCGIIVSLLKYELETNMISNMNSSVSSASSLIKFLQLRKQQKEEQQRKSTLSSTAPNWPVLVSDFNPLVLHNLYYNTILNEPSYNTNNSTTTDSTTTSTVYSNLDNIEIPSILSKVSLSSNNSFTMEESNIFSSIKNTSNNIPQPLMKTVHMDWNIYKTNSLTSNIGSTASNTLSSDNDDNYSSSTATNITTSLYFQNITHIYKQIDRSLTYDIILGSDMICSVDDCYGVGALLSVHLSKPSGMGIFMLAPSDVRWGVEKLSTILLDYGLHVETRTIPSNYVDTPNHYYSFPTNNIEAIQQSFTIPQDIQDTIISNSSDNNDNNKSYYDWVQKSSDITDIVVAGGYEKRLQLHIITWK